MKFCFLQRTVTAYWIKTVLFFKPVKGELPLCHTVPALLVIGSFSNDDGNGSEIVTQQDATERTLRRRVCGTD